MSKQTFEEDLLRLLKNIVQNGLRTRPTATTVNISMASITDTAFTSLTSGDFLRYNGSNWVNTTIAASDLPTGIDAAKIADGSVSNTEFQYLNGVTSAIQTQIDSKISASSTDTLTNKTFDANGTGNSLSNVDVEDLASGTDGELITWDSSGNPTTVAVGTAGHVLTSNGAGAAPTFQAASGGGGDWTLVSSATASSSASIDFTGLSSTYHAYKIIITGWVPATDASFPYMRTSTDNGSTWDSGASDYNWFFDLVVPTTSPTITRVGDNADSQIRLGGTLGTGVNEEQCWEITLFNPSDAVYAKVIGHGHTINDDGVVRFTQFCGTRLTAADVDAIQFFCSSGNIASGEFRLYGLSNA